MDNWKKREAEETHSADLMKKRDGGKRRQTNEVNHQRSLIL